MPERHPHSDHLGRNKRRPPTMTQGVTDCQRPNRGPESGIVVPIAVVPRTIEAPSRSRARPEPRCHSEYLECSSSQSEVPTVQLSSR
jgi:hypothetical protein